MSHFRSVTFEGSHLTNGACARLMSNPSSWTVEGRLPARSKSEILQAVSTGETQRYVSLPCFGGYVGDVCARSQNGNLRVEIELECILPEEELEIHSFIMFLVETDPGIRLHTEYNFCIARIALSVKLAS